MHKALEAHKEDAMSANKIVMNFNGNQGYAPEQINSKITLADLLEQVQEAIVQWGGDAEVVLHQMNNGYGANYGSLAGGYDLFDSTEEDGEY